MTSTSPRLYRGYRETTASPPGPAHVMVADDVEGAAWKPLNLALKLRSHSPTGPEWGYHGSGPRQLALAILFDHLSHHPDDLALVKRSLPLEQLDGAADAAKRLSQAYKLRVIGIIPAEAAPWVLASANVSAFLFSLFVAETDGGPGEMPPQVLPHFGEIEPGFSFREDKCASCGKPFAILKVCASVLIRSCDTEGCRALEALDGYGVWHRDEIRFPTAPEADEDEAAETPRIEAYLQGVGAGQGGMLIQPPAAERRAMRFIAGTLPGEHDPPLPPSLVDSAFHAFAEGIALAIKNGNTIDPALAFTLKLGECERWDFLDPTQRLAMNARLGAGPVRRGLEMWAARFGEDNLAKVFGGWTDPAGPT